MYKIKQASLADMNFLIEMAKNEGWDPGLCDAENFFATDNKGFFIGELDGIPISCISAVKYDGYGFIGFYIVKEEFRGRGFGLKIWQHALNYLKDVNVGLDGVVTQVENYKKFGFKLAHNNARYSGSIKESITDGNITNASLIDFEALCEYDKLHFGALRKNFLKKWINQKESSSLCYLKDNEIKGFGTVRKTFGAYKIGPLFAQDKDITQTLLIALTSKIKDAEFYLDINEEFAPAVELVNKYNMKKVFETKRMYTNEPPNAKWNEVFGITSFELG